MHLAKRAIACVVGGADGQHLRRHLTQDDGAQRRVRLENVRFVRLRAGEKLQLPIGRQNHRG